MHRHASIVFLLLIDGVMWMGYTHHSKYPNGHDSLAENGADDVTKVRRHEPHATCHSG